ncbi:hypothetical protein SFUMM280S_09494 [Streptomyces fumanus]
MTTPPYDPATLSPTPSPALPEDHEVTAPPALPDATGPAPQAPPAERPGRSYGRTPPRDSDVLPRGLPEVRRQPSVAGLCASVHLLA